MNADLIADILETIASNGNSRKMDHHHITVLAYGLISILDEVEGIAPSRERIRVYLRMLTKKAPHHARAILAGYALSYIRECTSVRCEQKELFFDF